MNKRPAPVTPAAETASQALANVDALLAARNAGWDRTAVRDIIHICYGSTEEFVKFHRSILRRMIMEGAKA
jgi:hypothetical protein